MCHGASLAADVNTSRREKGPVRPRLGCPGGRVSDTEGMGRTYGRIDDDLAVWLCAQPVFFVATAPLAGDGFVNCSPKGNRDEFAVLDGRRVAYLDQTG